MKYNECYEHDDAHEVKEGESCASASCILTICLLCEACLCACPAMDDSMTIIPHRVTILGKVFTHLVEPYRDEWAREHGYDDFEDAEERHSTLKNSMTDYGIAIPVLT